MLRGQKFYIFMEERLFGAVPNSWKLCRKEFLLEVRDEANCILSVRRAYSERLEQDSARPRNGR